MPRNPAASEITQRVDRTKDGVASASISGEVILPAGPEVGGYRLSRELLQWLSSTCPHFAGKAVCLRIAVLEEREGGVD